MADKIEYIEKSINFAGLGRVFAAIVIGKQRIYFATANFFLLRNFLYSKATRKQNYKKKTSEKENIAYNLL